MAEVPVKDKIEYTVALVSDFAKKYSLSTTQAFNYLDRFNAITLLEQHYNIAHTLAYRYISFLLQRPWRKYLMFLYHGSNACKQRTLP